MQFSRTKITIHHFMFLKAVQTGDLHFNIFVFLWKKHPLTFGGIDLFFLFFGQ